MRGRSPDSTPSHQDREPQMRQSAFRFEMAELPEALAEQTRRDIEEIIANPDNFIDKGGAGSVFRLPNGLCLKIMQPRRFHPEAQRMHIGNPPAIEAAYLRRVSDLIVEGVRAPRCYGYQEARNFQENDGLLMEELDAINLQHALNDEKLFPAHFNSDLFIDALQAYYDELHRIGIIHNDIAARNVMIDRKTALPRVIDFGWSRALANVPRTERDDLIRKDEIDFESTIIVPLYERPHLTKAK